MPGFPCETNWEVPVSNYLTANENMFGDISAIGPPPPPNQAKTARAFSLRSWQCRASCRASRCKHKCLPPTLFGKQFLKNMIRKRWKNQTVLRNKPRFSIFRVLLLGWSRLERPPFCRMLGIHAWVLKQTCQRVFTSFMKTLQGRSSNPHVRIQPLHQLFQHSSERCLGNEFFWLRNLNWIRLPSFL